jgi:hypothetical protein
VSANQKKLQSYPHVCPTCGKDFEGQKKQIHCSDECVRRRNSRISSAGETEKRCLDCGKWKPSTSDYYHNDKSRYDGFAPVCKPCSIKKGSAYKKTDHAKKLIQASNAKRIDTIREYRKKIQSLVNEREKIKSRTDPSFQLNRRMRCLMWVGLRKNKAGRRWQDLIGYSIDDLRRHIEKQFKDGMTWERFLAGNIHIDHKIPRAAFNYSRPEDPDFKKCWSLNNLQPMWASENMSKGARLEKPFQPSLTV